MSKQLLKELFSESIDANGVHVDVLIGEEKMSSDCGTGAGGFKPGNDCARGGGSGKKKESEKPKTRHIPSRFQNISDFEEKIVDQNFESCLAVDENGDVILQKDGGAKEIGFTANEVLAIRRANKATITHNHPSQMPFSNADLQFAADNNVYEMRVVTKDFVYVLRRPTGSEIWPDAGNAIAFYHEQKGIDIVEKYNKAIESGVMPAKQAEIEWNHETCKMTAAQFGLYYERF